MLGNKNRLVLLVTQTMDPPNGLRKTQNVTRDFIVLAQSETLNRGPNNISEEKKSKHNSSSTPHPHNSGGAFYINTTSFLCYNKLMNFDENFLQEMGLSAMPADKKQEFLNYIQEELEVRIGERISKGLTDEQLQEFDSLLGTEEAAKWLQKNRPDYREIVERSIQEMKDAISKNRAKLLA